MTKTLQIKEQDFHLHPSGAIYWEEKNMLLIADVHLGKIAHFRKHGAAIPANASEGNFTKLETVIEEFKPDLICFLGDLFHSKLNADWKNFKKWVEKTKAQIILIIGNHDIIPKYLLEELRIKIYDGLKIDDFLLTHHPTEMEGFFNFSGHMHPGISMKGPGRQYLKFPCFYKTKTQIVLPAFGNFTGKHILSPTENDEVFAIVEGEVICVSE